MINFSLNYIEDLLKVAKGKKIICIGENYLIMPKLLEIGITDEMIDCFCSCNENTPQDEYHHNYLVMPFSYLDTIDVKRYVLLIVDNNVDYIKKKLSQTNLAAKCDVIECFKIPLNQRYYLADEQLLVHRYKNTIHYWQEYCHGFNNDNIFEMSMIEANRAISRIILVLTTKCNLRCKDCIALTPLYHDGYHVPIATIMNAMKAFLSNVDICYCLELIGGEPFLYPNIDEVIEFLLKEKKVISVQITTNGLVRISKKTAYLLKNNKIHIRISDYKINSTLTATKFAEELETAGINYWIQKDIKWMPIGNLAKQYKTKQVLMDEYALCFEGLNCKTILNGRLYDCTFASRLSDLGLADDIEYLDLLYGDVTWDSIFKFWTRGLSLACDYCNIMNPNAVCIDSAMQMASREGSDKNGTCWQKENRTLGISNPSLV